MLVTALDEEEGQEEVADMKFQLLASLKLLPLTAYASKKQIKKAQNTLPNTFPFKVNANIYQSKESVVRNKELFFRKCMEQFPKQSHYGWIDRDYLNNPVYEYQAFQWDLLEDQKIHVGMKLQGVDTSLYIIPKEKLLWFMTRLNMAYSQGASSENEAFETIIAEDPQIFTVYDYSDRHQLIEAFYYE